MFAQNNKKNERRVVSIHVPRGYEPRALKPLRYVAFF